MIRQAALAKQQTQNHVKNLGPHRSTTEVKLDDSEVELVEMIGCRVPLDKENETTDNTYDWQNTSTAMRFGSFTFVNKDGGNGEEIIHDLAIYLKSKGISIKDASTEDQVRAAVTFEINDH